MIMRLLALLLILMITHSFPALASVCDEWDNLQRAVRDNQIDRRQAELKIIELDKRLLKEFSGKVGNSPFTFPVKGYGKDCVGGSNGSGYRPGGYDFYDGNRHGGHPAHDLFIHDGELDGLDDDTGKSVEVVAFTDGVVTGVNTAWEYPSNIRGGIYIWIFNPATNRFYYYAHLAKALVKPGEVVKSGDTIGLLGRSGKNAWAKRSPTHLHFMSLSFDEGRMTPHDTWLELPDR